MENASKALIIAGAILLSILLIAVGMFIFQQAQSQIDNSASKLDKSAIETHNKQFSQYEGVQTGTQVKALLQSVMTNNVAALKEENGRFITIDGGVVTVNSQSGPTDSTNYGNEIKKIKTNKKYDLTMKYTNGLINHIVIGTVK